MSQSTVLVAINARLPNRVEPGPLPRIPLEYSLGPAFPNPTRREVRWSLSLPRPGKVQLEVIDVAGRRVGTPFQGSLEAGIHELQWFLPAMRSGVFFVRAYVDRRLISTRRFVLIR